MNSELNLDLPEPVDLVYDKYESTTNNNKSPILICHGMFSSKKNWGNVPARLANETGRNVYIFDLRDHGDSPWTECFTFQAMISDLLQVIKNNKIEKAIMMGHSLGGMLLSRLATAYPSLVEKLILVDINPFREVSKPNKITQVIGLLTKTIEIIKKENLDLKSINLNSVRERADELLAPIKDERSRKGFVFNLIERDNQLSWKFNLEQLIVFIDYIFGPKDFVPYFNGPALEVYGIESDFFREDDIELVKKMLPNCQFQAVNGQHSPYATHPDEFLSIVVPFINT